jgi:hypothetical protein
MSGLRDFGVSKRNHTMSNGGRLSRKVGCMGVLQSPPGKFMSRQMIFVGVMSRRPVSVSGEFVHLSGFLVILVMRAIVVSSGHIYNAPIFPDLLWASLASW